MAGVGECIWRHLSDCSSDCGWKCWVVFVVVVVFGCGCSECIEYH